MRAAAIAVEPRIRGPWHPAFTRYLRPNSDTHEPPYFFVGTSRSTSRVHSWTTMMEPAERGASGLSMTKRWPSGATSCIGHCPSARRVFHNSRAGVPALSDVTVDSMGTAIISSPLR